MGFSVSVVFVAVHRAVRDDYRRSPFKTFFPAKNPPYIVRRKIHPYLGLCSQPLTANRFNRAAGPVFIPNTEPI